LNHWCFYLNNLLMVLSIRTLYGVLNRFLWILFDSFGSRWLQMSLSSGVNKIMTTHCQKLIICLPNRSLDLKITSGKKHRVHIVQMHLL
jgi:hypothetical protein